MVRLTLTVAMAKEGAGNPNEGRNYAAIKRELGEKEFDLAERILRGGVDRRVHAEKTGGFI